MTCYIKIKNRKQICSLTVVLLPILSIYKSPIRAIDLGTFMVIAVLGLGFIVGWNRSRDYKAIVRLDIWALYIGYIIMITGVSLLSDVHYANPATYVFRLIKNLIFIAFTLFICRKGFFDLNYAFKYYGIAVMIATLVIYLQFICYAFFRYDLAGYNPNWAAVEGYVYRASNLATGYFRPTSIFYEPAHYFEYVSISLVLYLIYSEDSKDLIKAVLITLGVMFSTSGQGIVFTGFIWGIWFLKALKKMTRKKAMSILSAVILLAMTGCYFMYSQYGRQAIARILSPGESAIISGRSDGYVQLQTFSALECIFGRGYGNYTSTFFSSWSFNLYCLGIVGTVIVAMIYVYCWKHTDKKIVVLLNALMCVFSNVFMGFYFIFFFCFILVSSNAHLSGRDWTIRIRVRSRS